MCVYWGGVGGGVGKKKARGERDLGKFLGWEEGEMCKDGDAEAGRVSGWRCTVQEDSERNTRLIVVMFQVKTQKPDLEEGDQQTQTFSYEINKH